MVIVEFCKFGNLSTYLRSKRNEFVPYKVWHSLTQLWLHCKMGENSKWYRLIFWLKFCEKLVRGLLTLSLGCHNFLFYLLGGCRLLMIYFCGFIYGPMIDGAWRGEKMGVVKERKGSSGVVSVP